jgi:hypothetical protein
MAIGWTEIRNRATAFAKEWKDETSERAEAQTFWISSIMYSAFLADA